MTRRPQDHYADVKEADDNRLPEQQAAVMIQVRCCGCVLPPARARHPRRRPAPPAYSLFFLRYCHVLGCPDLWSSNSLGRRSSSHASPMIVGSVLGSAYTVLQLSYVSSHLHTHTPSPPPSLPPGLAGFMEGSRRAEYDRTLVCILGLPSRTHTPLTPRIARWPPCLG